MFFVIPLRDTSSAETTYFTFKELSYYFSGKTLGDLKASILLTNYSQYNFGIWPLVCVIFRLIFQINVLESTNLYVSD